jgi:hypothetical protein
VTWVKEIFTGAKVLIVDGWMIVFRAFAFHGIIGCDAPFMFRAMMSRGYVNAKVHSGFLNL